MESEAVKKLALWAGMTLTSVIGFFKSFSEGVKKWGPVIRQE